LLRLTGESGLKSIRPRIRKRKPKFRPTGEDGQDGDKVVEKLLLKWTV